MKDHIREHYLEKLNCFGQDHKMMQAITLYSCSFFVGRWQNLTDEHIQIAKEVVFEQVAERIFDGIEPTFITEEAYNWWNNLSIDYFEKKYEMVLKNPDDWNNREWIPNLDKQLGWGLKKGCEPPEDILFELDA